MDQPDIPLRTETPAGVDNQVEQQIRSLRGTIAMLLIGCCCLGAGLALFLYRQVATVNVQVIQTRQVLLDYQSNALPRIQWFVSSLQNFGKTNADFAPILTKYGMMPTNAASSAANLVNPGKK